MTLDLQGQTCCWRSQQGRMDRLVLYLPVVHPSLGEMALMQGMAAEGYRPGYSAGISWALESLVEKPRGGCTHFYQ